MSTDKNNGSGEHYIKATIQADGNVHLDANATIVEQLGIAALIKKNAIDMLDAARMQQAVAQAESAGMVRQLGDLRRTS
jgi:hypothetical protein